MAPELIFSAAFVIVLGAMLFRIVKSGGLRGAMFGARVASTVGELDLGKQGLIRTKLKVHHLEPDQFGNAAVGLEIVTRSFASYHILPIRLTCEQARSLNGLLTETLARS